MINPTIDSQFLVHLITCSDASSPVDIHWLFYRHDIHFHNSEKGEKLTLQKQKIHFIYVYLIYLIPLGFNYPQKSGFLVLLDS